MKFLDDILSRSKTKDSKDRPPVHPHVQNPIPFHTRAPPNPTSRFPPELLVLLLSYVCPHSQDASYTSSEESIVDACNLCDARDLAQCALVNKQWARAAQDLLYVSFNFVVLCD